MWIVYGGFWIWEFKVCKIGIVFWIYVFQGKVDPFLLKWFSTTVETKTSWTKKNMASKQLLHLQLYPNILWLGVQENHMRSLFSETVVRWLIKLSIQRLLFFLSVVLLFNQKYVHGNLRNDVLMWRNEKRCLSVFCMCTFIWIRFVYLTLHYFVCFGSSKYYLVSESIGEPDSVVS